MCNPISWWYVRSNGVGKVFISDKTDSHSEAAAEFGIKDDGLGEVCAGEFRPDYKSPSPNTSTWKLVWDYLGRTRRPAWMDDEAEASLRAALERECSKYVYTTGRHEVTSCRAFAFREVMLVVRGACDVAAYGSSHVVALGSNHVVAHDTSSVEACGSSHVEARGSSRVDAYGSSQVVARESSHVNAWRCSRVESRDNSKVDAYESSHIVAYGSSQVVARGFSNVEARESSRVVARDTSSIDAWGTSHVVARGSSRVAAWESSHVVAHGSTHVIAHGSSHVEAQGANHVVAWDTSRVEVKSEYADVVGRGAHDGNGHPILRTPIKAGCTYTIKYDALVAETSNTEGDAP